MSKLSHLRLPASSSLTDLLKNPPPAASTNAAGAEEGVFFCPPPPHSAALACLKLAEIVEFVVSDTAAFVTRAKDLAEPLEDLVLGLCRMPGKRCAVVQ